MDEVKSAGPITTVAAWPLVKLIGVGAVVVLLPPLLLHAARSDRAMESGSAIRNRELLRELSWFGGLAFWQFLMSYFPRMFLEN